MQKRRYRAVIDRVSEALGLTSYDNVLDVGCGTGALCSVLHEKGFVVTGIDLSIASYVAHGLQKNERKQMYAEMSRVSKSKVIIYDYNQERGVMTSVIEWLERGDYFNFIKEAEAEMNECFSEIHVVDVDSRATWYICTPN